MSLCSQATEVLRQNPGRYMTAAEVVQAVTGRPADRHEGRRMEHALLVLVDNETAWPMNDPDAARSFRLREGEGADMRSRL